MAFVPEGRCDGSHSTRYRLLVADLVRSAWDSATQRSRPVGYGLIRAGLRTDSMKFRIRQYGAHPQREMPLKCPG
jgi:hypothetical protein